MSQRPLIAVTDSVFPSLDPALAALRHLRPEIRMARSTSEADILAIAREADAVLVTYARLPAALLCQLQRCKVIGRFGLGVDNIDLPAASQLGIVVTYVPDYCLHEVSDHAMALILALARKVAYANSLVQSGRWEMKAVAPLHRLKDQILGLVGFGNIPRLIAPKASVFGLKVMAHDPYISKAIADAHGVELVGFEQILERSDFLSVHTPLTAQTKRMFNGAAFRKMKRGAFFINTARGALVDEADLLQALESGHLGGAALDVVAEEPLSSNSPLLGRANVILTPHIAFYSVEALVELQTKCATDVARVLSGEAPVYPAK